MVQWLGLGAFTAVGPGSIPGWGTRIPQAMQQGKKTKTKQNSPDSGEELMNSVRNSTKDTKYKKVQNRSWGAEKHNN